MVMADGEAAHEKVVMALDAGNAVGMENVRLATVDDDEERNSSLEQFKKEMDLVLEIGGKRIAAPPAGINRNTGMDLRKVAERYRVVLELGRQAGVLWLPRGIRRRRSFRPTAACPRAQRTRDGTTARTLSAGRAPRPHRTRRGRVPR